MQFLIKQILEIFKLRHKVLLTRDMKIYVFLFLFFVGLAQSSCPGFGCPIEANFDDLDSNLADFLKKLTTASVFELENSECDFDIVSISNFKSQVKN